MRDTPPMRVILDKEPWRYRLQGWYGWILRWRTIARGSQGEMYRIQNLIEKAGKP